MCEIENALLDRAHYHRDNETRAQPLDQRILLLMPPRLKIVWQMILAAVWARHDIDASFSTDKSVRVL
jgi:hypothetical protein